MTKGKPRHFWLSRRARIYDGRILQCDCPEYCQCCEYCTQECADDI